MLTGVALFLLLLIGLLAIPVALTFQLSRRQTFQGNVTLFWLFGLVRVNIPLSELKKTEVSNSKRKKTKPSSGKGTNPLAVIRNRKFRRRLFQFFRDFWGAVHKENVSVHVKIGLGDPADTGQLWAVVGPISGMLAGIHKARIEIQPEFVDACFELDSSGTIRLVPLEMILIVLKLLLSPIFWQGMKKMRAVGVSNEEITCQ